MDQKTLWKKGNSSNRPGVEMPDENGCDQKREPRFAWRRLLRSETGAVSVDWLVLTAAIVMLAFAVVSQVSGGTQELSGNVRKCVRIQAKLVAKDIPYEKQLKRIARRCSKL